MVFETSRPSVANSESPEALSNESLEGYLERRRATIPPVVYVPVTGQGAPGFIELEMQKTLDGRLALLAYSALDRLMDGCGAEQPWALYPTAQLHELSADQPFDVIYLDVPLPESLRKPRKES